MIKNDIKSNQIATLFIAFVPILKIITLPSILSAECSNSLWLPPLIFIATDILLILMIFRASKTHENNTFFGILTDNFSLSFARIVYFIYALFFALKAFIPMLENKAFVENSLYEVIPLPIVYFPIFAVTAYLSLKGLKVLGRASQLCAFITGIGIILTIYLSATSGDFGAFLPLFENPNRIFSTFYKSIFWFNDCIYLLFFMGHFKWKKNTLRNLTISYSAAMAMAVAILMCFFAIYQNIAPSQQFAVSAMNLFSPSLTSVGRFDYIAIFLLIFSGVFASGIPVMLSCKCLERAFNFKNALIPTLIVNTILLIGVAVLSAKFTHVVAFYQKYLAIFFFICGYILPILSLFGGKKHATQVQTC